MPHNNHFSRYSELWMMETNEMHPMYNPNPGTPVLLCFALLLFIDTALLFVYFGFYRLKVPGNPLLSKFMATIFPTTFAHFVSPSHALVILAIFQTLSLLLHLLW